MISTEGSAINRPPFFDGKNYTFWKCRMKIFLKSLDPKCWLVVEKGFAEPTITPWSSLDKDLIHANATALNAINCGVSPEEFKSIMTCETAKATWEVLELSHEGTS